MSSRITWLLEKVEGKTIVLLKMIVASHLTCHLFYVYKGFSDEILEQSMWVDGG
jgi:hypothetical protein